MAKSLGSLDADTLLPEDDRSTVITGFLNTVWDSVSGFIDFSPDKVVVESGEPLALSLLISEAMVRPELKRTITKLNAQGLEGLRAHLRAGIKAGNVRPDVDVENQAKIIYAFLRGQTTFAVLDPAFDPERVAEIFIANLQLTLRPEPLGRTAAEAQASEGRRETAD